MGGCFPGNGNATLKSDERKSKKQLLSLRSPLNKSTNLWCINSPKDVDAGPFHYQVEFMPGNVFDSEAKLIRSLIELVWIKPPKGSPNLESSRKAGVDTKVKELRALRDQHCAIFRDYVVLIVNVMLHASCNEVRTKLWDSLVLPTAESDFTLAHLFFWAFKAAASSPQAERETKLDAETKLNTISSMMSSRSNVASTHAIIEAANSALKLGAKLPDVHSLRPCNVSPLVDLLQRLHGIGVEIVKVKDKATRLHDLRCRLQKEINEKMVARAPVPVPMLAPHTLQGRTFRTHAKILQFPTSEARVLSSKERAPYLVVLEIEACNPDGDGFGVFSLRGSKKHTRASCLCRRSSGRATSTSVEQNSLLHQRSVDNTSSVSSSSSFPLTKFSKTSLPRNNMQVHEDDVANYLCKEDRRPKGIFGRETWDEVVERVRGTSKHSARPGWDMLPLIVKSNADDVRQEELAYRLLRWFQRIFKRHNLKLWLQPFLIIATTHDGGCLETVSNAISLSELKKGYGSNWHSLKEYFDQTFPLVLKRELRSMQNFGEGNDVSSNGKRKLIPRSTAIMNFIWSMAAYSIVCYILAIRDRHNGNILIDNEGHILHVDFGFMLSGAPGGKALQKMGGFEHAQGFKLTAELVDVLGPLDGTPFKAFREAVLEGMLAVREHAEELLGLLQLSMLGSENSLMNCFCHPRGYPEAVLEDVSERLGFPIDGMVETNEDFRISMDQKIEDSVDHWRSRLYDSYQFHFTGVH